MIRVSVVLIAVGALAGPSRATPVRGTVTLPAADKSADTPSGYWRVENGLLPIGPRADQRGEVVVIIEGEAPPKAKEATSVTVELHGLKLDPRVAVITVGGTVTFKNSDRVPHTLYVDHAESLMPPLPTPTGQSRAQKFSAAGAYRVRDEECPHVDGMVLVTDAAYAILDDKGSFKLDVPEGHYTLRVLWRGAWAYSQPVTVGAHAQELAVTVPPRAKAE